MTTDSKWPLCYCSHFHTSGLCLSVLLTVCLKSGHLLQAPPRKPWSIPSKPPSGPAFLSSSSLGNSTGSFPQAHPVFYCRAWNRAPLPAERTSCSTSLKPPGGAAVYGREGPQKSQISFFCKVGTDIPGQSCPDCGATWREKKGDPINTIKNLSFLFSPPQMGGDPVSLQAARFSLHTPRRPL